MKIIIYEKDSTFPIEVWENCSFVPNVGDGVSTSTSGPKTVVHRVFEKNAVYIRVK